MKFIEIELVPTRKIEIHKILSEKIGEFKVCYTSIEYVDQIIATNVSIATKKAIIIIS